MSPGSSCAAFAITSGSTVELAPGLNFLVGPVGSGKTSVVEALHVGCTGRSFRTSNEREMVRFGESGARVELACRGAGGAHRIEVVLQPGAPKLIKRDGATLSVLRADPSTPRVCVFAPDHLELVKGAAGIRRAHLDELVTALWPARRATRVAYAKALAQRNSLLGPRALRECRARRARSLGPRAGPPRNRADAPPRATRSGCWPSTSRRGPVTSACRARRRSPTARVRRPPTRTGWRRSCASGCRRTSSAGSPPTARIATISS